MPLDSSKETTPRPDVRTRATEIEVIPKSGTSLPQKIDEFAENLGIFLERAGLPTEKVLVPLEEREALFRNLRPVVNKVSADQRSHSHYLSKFVAATVVGLFDAALNYVWNETITNLRRKVASFDLDYFFDAVLAGDRNRDSYRTEHDLEKLEDWQLITGCKKTGIISEIGYKHLDYVRDMRNFASAAHPNHVGISGIQLAAWLEQCIIEVLSKPPEADAIHIQSLLRNLRGKKLSGPDIEPITLQVERLPVPFANSLLHALFGMYVDPRVEPDVKGNIGKIAPAAWRRSDEESRNEIGLKFARFSANAETGKKTATKDFLNAVDGLPYLSEDMLALEIKELAGNLWRAHTSFNNFYSEEVHAQALQKVVSRLRRVPPIVRDEYVRVLLRCRLGNIHGVAFAATPFYESMINSFGVDEIIAFAQLTGKKEFQDQFERNPAAARTFVELAVRLREQTSDPNLKNLLGVLAKSTSGELQVGRAWVNVENVIKQIRRS